MRKISKTNPMPLYFQLKEIIQEMIDNEELKPNDPIPTERELCEYHGISRMTVREAIMSLVNEGVLYRVQGKGTFVSSPKPKQQLSVLKSLTEDMAQLGRKVETKILSFDIEPATISIAKALKLQSNTNQVIRLKRLRIVDSVPYAIETVWLDYGKFSDLTRQDIEGRSLYDLLRTRYHLELKYARQTVEPIQINEYEAELLEMQPNALGLLFRRTTHDANDDIVEYTKSIYRADKHKFEIYLQAN